MLDVILIIGIRKCAKTSYKDIRHIFASELFGEMEICEYFLARNLE